MSGVSAIRAKERERARDKHNGVCFYFMLWIHVHYYNSGIIGKKGIQVLFVLRQARFEHRDGIASDPSSSIAHEGSRPSFYFRQCYQAGSLLQTHI